MLKELENKHENKLRKEHEEQLRRELKYLEDSLKAKKNLCFWLLKMGATSSSKRLIRDMALIKLKIDKIKKELNG